MDWIGSKATGTRWDIHGGRTGFREYRYGYRTRGIIIRLKGRKYEIEGDRYIVTPEGEFRIGRGKDYFFDSRIQVEAESEESELCLTK
jgi:hypothetical protein